MFLVPRHSCAKAISLLLACVAYTPAMATVSGPYCGDSLATTGNAGYLGCQGSLAGNIAPGQTDTATFAEATYALVGKSDDTAFGPFSQNPGALGSGTLSFDGVVKGLFVLGIKGGPSYSLYLFDGGSSGIHSLRFDTDGIAKGNGRSGPDLSHLALFGPAPVSAVPEPQSYLLLMGGLGLVMGLLRRGRRTPGVAAV